MMRRIRKYLWVLPVMFVVAACGRRVLSQREMTDILFDIHRTEATLKVLTPNMTRIERQEYYNSIFEKYDITKEDFDNSLDWYARHPDKLSEVYDTLKLRADDFQKKVESYGFHPDEKPTHADSVDEFDLWHWQRKQLLEATVRKPVPSDSLQFEISDKDYFARGNELKFRLRMRAVSTDTTVYRTRLVFHYNDSLSDTLCHTSFADTLTRRFYFYKLLPDSLDVRRMEIILIDSLRNIGKVEIDSVELIRVFNKYDSPIPYRVRKEIREANDSIAKSKKKVGRTGKTKKNGKNEKGVGKQSVA